MKNLRLKSARTEKNLSQQELADLVGVSRQTINAIEQGDYNPTIRLCISICKALGKTLDDLFWDPDSR
ncbi:MAG: helix-turn-helix transcriptional regulator [Stecheria intestinalis]|jgi:putative transcriptional regulator|nr:helix-turn-helix transcriptional regulator [Anaerolactibacter massiliensis]MDD6366664.1 helix-turn-helix transcriptional regulator [Stecheria intestinalis]MDY4682344.1 helix-turn-helix transcriptional regulator [Lachnospiraceae bacterium]